GRGGGGTEGGSLERYWDLDDSGFCPPSPPSPSPPSPVPPSSPSPVPPSTVYCPLDSVRHEHERGARREPDAGGGEVDVAEPPGDRVPHLPLEREHGRLDVEGE